MQQRQFEPQQQPSKPRQHVRYFRTAWHKMTANPNWLAICIRLWLINLIPIFGQIVTWGYLGRWCQQIANGYDTAMPDRIFDPVDGMLLHRGVIGWGVEILISLMLGVILSLITMPLSLIPPAGTVIEYVLTLLLYLLYAGIYALALQAMFLNDFDYGFKFPQLFRAMKADSGEYLRCACVILVSMLVVLFVALIIAAIVLAAFMASGQIDLATLQSISSTTDYTALSAAIGSVIGPIMVVYLVLIFVATLLQIPVTVISLVATTMWMTVYLNPSGPVQRPYFTQMYGQDRMR